MADESGSGPDPSTGRDPGGDVRGQEGPATGGVPGGGLGSMSANAPGGYNGLLGADERMGAAMGPFTGWTTPTAPIPGWVSTPVGMVLSAINPALGFLAKLGLMGYNAYANAQNARGSQPLGVGGMRSPASVAVASRGASGGPQDSAAGGAQLINFNDPLTLARMHALLQQSGTLGSF
jgi:hypothetical protein